VLDVKRVADQIQEGTMPAAIRPGLTERKAVLNSSAAVVE
jgi:hypothetical protein